MKNLFENFIYKMAALPLVIAPRLANHDFAVTLYTPPPHPIFEYICVSTHEDNVIINCVPKDRFATEVASDINVDDLYQKYNPGMYYLHDFLNQHRTEVQKVQDDIKVSKPKASKNKLIS